MNLAIEAALASWLRSLDPFEGLAIHTGQTNEEIPGDASALVVACDTIEAVGGQLHRATASILLTTPAVLDIEHHTTLAAALRTAVYSPTALDAAFAPAVLHGAVLLSYSETQASDRWLTTAQLVLGISGI